ncbi:hypothetical protein AK51_25060 [Serratia nematodiphila DZ0503SBS1]|nr:hypothetical protein AK51_25060 [Serratia nematodiphila DZ0503SBS1]
MIADIVTDWVAVAAERSNLAVAQQTMESAKRSLEVTRKNQQHGISSLVDVASAETVYQQARSDAASYATSAAQAKNALDLAVGQSVPETCCRRHRRAERDHARPAGRGFFAGAADAAGRAAGGA